MSTTTAWEIIEQIEDKLEALPVAKNTPNDAIRPAWGLPVLEASQADRVAYLQITNGPSKYIGDNLSNCEVGMFVFLQVQYQENTLDNRRRMLKDVPLIRDLLLDNSTYPSGVTRVHVDQTEYTRDTRDEFTVYANWLLKVIFHETSS